MAEEFRKKILADPDRTTTIQKLLDENAQLLKVLVENMAMKGKAAECIQYQQTLHKNLVKLSYLAQPTLDVNTSIPPPPGLPPASSASQGGVSSATPTSGESSKPVSTSSNCSSTSSSMAPSGANNPDMRGTPPKVGLSKSYSTNSSWPPGDPYGNMPPGMQQRSAMGGGTTGSGGGGGHMGPPGNYPPPPMAGMSHDHQLRMHQEQLIHAQQARRMQHQQQAAVGGGMYGMPPPQPPQGPGMMGPMMSHPSQGAMPPSYPQPNVPPPGKSAGSRQPSKMH